MALKFYDSPFHVTHDAETASKMAMKMDLSIMISGLIKQQGLTQVEAAEKLEITQSRVSEVVNSKIEKFTLDAMFDLLDKLGFRAVWAMPSLEEASITITRQAA